MINSLLIIEDNKGDVRLIQEYLSESNIYNPSVKWAESIISAQNLLNKESEFDVILLDLNLPDAHGIESFNKIYSIVPHIPIIVLTGIDDEQYIGDIIGSGAQDYLIKGYVDSEILYRSIRYAIDRKKAEKILRNSNMRFQLLIEKNPDPIIVVNHEGIISFVNPSFEKLFKISKENFYGRTLGIPILTDNTIDINIAGINSQNIVAEMRVVETSWQEQKAYIISLHDITHRHKLEKNLQQTAIQLKDTLKQLKITQTKVIESEKLKALVTLTAGIAHELNNPLAGIIQYVEYCIKYTDSQNKIHPVLEDIRHETKRCVDIINNLLTFTRYSHNQKLVENTHIGKVIDRVIRLLSFRIEKEKINIIKHIEDNTPLVKINISNMQQVFINLITNAIDALKYVSEKKIHIYVFVKNRNLIITIQDNGCGIDKNNYNRIYDPFFTNKPVGQGTGLGLSISKSIIEEHNGSISFESEKNNGTIFKIILPLKTNYIEEEI